MAGETGNNSPTLTPDGKQPTQPAGWCVKRTGPGPESPRQGLTASLWPCDLGQVTSYLWLSHVCKVKRRILASSGGGRRYQPECVWKLLSTPRGAAHAGISTVLFTPRFPFLPLIYTCILSTSAIPREYFLNYNHHSDGRPWSLLLI